MSIKIEIDAATGAEAREQMLGLLAMGGVITAKLEPVEMQAIKAQMQILAGEPGEKLEADGKTPFVEQVKKRRTKAEIEAEKKTAEQEISAEEVSDTATTLTQDNAEQNIDTEFPTLQDLQRVCAILVRAGYKQQGIDFIKNVGGADTSKDVVEDKRQACIDAMTKFAEENKIAL